MAAKWFNSLDTNSNLEGYLLHREHHQNSYWQQKSDRKELGTKIELFASWLFLYAAMFWIRARFLVHFDRYKRYLYFVLNAQSKYPVLH